MSTSLSQLSRPATVVPSLPKVRLEVRQGTGQNTTYQVPEVGFLVGTVPGCDMRVPGKDLPAVLFLVAPQPGGAGFRKLAATQAILINGKSAANGTLQHGDRITLGSIDLFVQIELPKAEAPPPAAPAKPEAPAVVPKPPQLESAQLELKRKLQLEAAQQDLQKKHAKLDADKQVLQTQLQQLKEEKTRFQKEREGLEKKLRDQQLAQDLRGNQLEERQRLIEAKAKDLEADRALRLQRREQEWEAKHRSPPPAAPMLVPQGSERERVRQDLEDREEALAQRVAQVARREASLEAHLNEVDRQKQELAAGRQEVTELRRQLYDQYQERRDRLSGLQEAVNRAAQKIQDQKRELEQERRDLAGEREGLDNLKAGVEDRSIKLTELTQRLDEDRRLFDQRRGGLDQELATREARLVADRQRLEKLQTQYQADFLRLDRRQGQLEEREKVLQAKEQDVEVKFKQVQEHRSELEELEALRASVEDRAVKLTELARRLDEDRRLFEQRRGGLDQELATRETRLAGDRQTLEKLQTQYQADVLRLDRRHGQLEEREKILLSKEQDFELKFKQLQQHSADMEEQVLEVDRWRSQVVEEKDKLTQQKMESDALAHQLAQRAASIEGQQATLAALRTRLERMRDDIRREEQQLVEERGRQEKAQADFQLQLDDVQRVRAELQEDQKIREQERQQLAERSAVLDAAVNQVRQTQDRLAAEEAVAKQRQDEFDQHAARLREQEGVLTGRLTQVEEAQQRLEAERQALRDRTQTLAQAEQVRETLQEQLRRRSEELAVRQRALSDQFQQVKTQAVELETKRAEVDQQQHEIQQQLADWQQQIRSQADDLERRRAEMQDRDEILQGQAEKLKEAGRHIGGLRKSLAEERLQAKAELEERQAAHARIEAELEAWRREVKELLHQAPDLELRVTTSLERLAGAREQMRDYLAEIHAYSRSCREDLEQCQRQAEQEVARLEQREQNFRRDQDEHRLEVVAFRQQLITWQGQLSDRKKVLTRDVTRLERQQAVVDQKARDLSATTQQLARQAEELQVQKKVVAGRRQQVDSHLTDMRQWYKQKLRDLAGNAVTGDQAATTTNSASLLQPDAGAPPSSEPGAEDGIDPTTGNRNILSMTGPADGADRRLGEVLQSLELVDPETLTALLVEARRQRRSLRQVLLSSGVVTLYQLALIEAGNEQGLMLGPVRVVDRLRSSPREALYRVFDPRRGHEAALRHLGEAEMQDAAHVEEYRQSFTQARLEHANLAATYEVLDIAGRPAVVQEWVTGLAGQEWPPLASVPGVCFRLLSQAALGLATIHNAGQAHGHLQDHSLILTGDGLLKVCGLGEPPWLATPQFAPGASAAADLVALGQIVSGWCSPQAVRKGAKVKPLPDPLVDILFRLRADSGQSFASAQAVLDELDHISAAIPPNQEAWDRLIRHVRDNAAPAAALRQSA